MKLVRLTLAAALAAAAGCTYAPPVPEVRVTHHARRAASDSFAVAVYAARRREPTGIAAFPDGGSPRLDGERGLIYLCVAPDSDRAVTVRRVASLAPAPEMRHGFEPWVSLWDGPTSFVVSILGYDRASSDAAARHKRWLRVSLAGVVDSLAAGPTALPPATSLPPPCEAAIVDDARRLLRDEIERAGA